MIPSTFVCIMASPPATSPLRDHSCDRKKQQTNTSAPALLFPGPTGRDEQQTDTSAPALLFPGQTGRDTWQQTGISAPALLFPEQTGQDRQQTDTPVLLSLKQNDPSNTDTASKKDRKTIDNPSEDDCKIVGSTSKNDRKIIGDAFQAIQAAFYGNPTEAYPSFYFEDPSSFQLLQEQLKDCPLVGFSQFVDNELRFDWDASVGALLLRLMPTTIHDTFESLIAETLRERLDDIVAKHPSLKSIRKKIYANPHENITGEGFSKSPDGQVRHDATDDPLLIFEVAYSEGERKVMEKAKQYLWYLSDCTLLTFDLKYARPGERIEENHVHDAVISLYQTGPREPKNGRSQKTVDLVHENRVFRKAGRPVEGKIEISFDRFVPMEERKHLRETAVNVCIDFADLSRFLQRAEAKQRRQDVRIKPQPESYLLKRPNGEEEEVVPAPNPAKRQRTQR
ncbi:hypothetical protein F5X98DRAFT_359720 [Xylaria grammica]|nr:hypothetical protein F5X98DRAFT_359720 [Xylaria grammica]